MRTRRPGDRPGRDDDAGDHDAGRDAAPATVPSPFKTDRASSEATGLTPNTTASPVRYPEQSVVLTWGDVPKAAGYTVEIADNPGFNSVIWTGQTTQAIAVPEILLPDGAYWWRVRAVDAAGTQGVWSDVARVAKVWPNQIGNTRFAATPTGAAASFTELNPYLFWGAVPGAKSYDVQVSPGDQFNNVIFTGTNLPQPFASPAAVGALPDDTYSWRVRARDANDNTGPWTVASTFTKAWGAATETAPDFGATTEDLQPQVDAGRRRAAVRGADHRPPEQLGRSPPEVRRQDRRELPHADVPGGARQGAAPSATSGGACARSSTASTAAGRRSAAGSTGSRRTAAPAPRRPPSSARPATAAPACRRSSTGRRSPGPRCTAIDIATDPNFNNIVEQQLTSSTSWTSRVPLPDNQITSGYYWRVIWGSGSTVDEPNWSVAEDEVDSASFRKQTQVTLGSPAAGGVVSDPPLLNWGSVPGIAKYDVELSQDGKFADGTTRKATLFGLGAVPGGMSDGEKRLPDGTWNWRVRAVDGGDLGQSWSPVSTFTLNSQRPTQKLPNDGASVVYSPLITWTAVAGACSYDVQVSRDSSFSGADDASILTTAQTAIVPPGKMITTPGVHFWRVRAGYCSDVKGQWTPTRSFRSVFPPDFNLNSVPAKVDYGRKLVIGGQLKNNGAAVKKARLFLERRTYPSDAFRAAGVVNTNNSGRFRFSLKMNRTADYRLIWREEANHPQGSAAFGIDVQPRVTFRLATSRVVRRKGLVVKGTRVPQAARRWCRSRPPTAGRTCARSPPAGTASRWSSPPGAWTPASTSCASTSRVTASAASSTRPASSAASSSTTSSSSADAARRPHRVLGHRGRPHRARARVVLDRARVAVAGR